MSDDLVKRLQRIQVGMANEEEDAVLDAIAAIERLTAEVAALNQRYDDLNDAYGQELLRVADLKVRVEAAEAEAARLRSVLNVLVSALDATHWSSWQTTYIFQKPLDDARSALRGEEG